MTIEQQKPDNSLLDIAPLKPFKLSIVNLPPTVLNTSAKGTF